MGLKPKEHPMQSSFLGNGVDTFLANISTGDPVADLLALLLAVTTVGALAALRAAFRSPAQSESRKNAPGGIADQAASYPLGGKIERLDRTLSEFRSETLRAAEILKSQVERNQASLAAIERALKLSPPTAPAPIGPSDGPGKGSDTEAGASIPSSGTPSEPSAVTSGIVSRETQAVVALKEESVVPFEEVPSQAPASLSSRLKSTRKGIFEKLRSVFLGKPKLDAEMVEELRALLISADLGAKTVEGLLSEMQASLERGQEVSEEGFTLMLKGKLRELLEKDVTGSTAISPSRVDNGPKVVLVVGVNGVGKTTTVAKLAHQWKAQGARVLLVAADTFRAAAVAQLSEWASRLKVPVVTGADGAKPATVVFEAMQRAATEEFDVIIIDTAGRLQTKANLMQELGGIRGAIERHQPGAPHETILVVDGSTGQNAINQAREFHEAVSLSGLVVTKLDGTPKGGVVVAIKNEFGIPVRYIGVGESPADLRIFDAAEFVEALFERTEDDASNVVPLLVSEHGEQRRRRRSA
jgi:fused signal recognition particle receptor